MNADIVGLTLAGWVLGILGSFGGTQLGSATVPPALEKPHANHKIEGVDWKNFPRLRGGVSAASGIFNSYKPPRAGEIATLDLRDPQDVKLSFDNTYISVETSWKVQQVFWDPKTGEFAGMRIVADNPKAQSQYTLDLYCRYRVDNEFFRHRVMSGFLVENFEGRVRSVAGFHFEFEGELPKRP